MQYINEYIIIFESSETLDAYLRGSKIQSELGEAQLNKFEITRSQSYFGMCKLYIEIDVLFCTCAKLQGKPLIFVIKLDEADRRET